MLRRFMHILRPFKVVLSLPCAAALFVALAGATLMPETARAADLRVQTKPAEQREAPPDRRRRLFDEFLRYLEKQNQ